MYGQPECIVSNAGRLTDKMYNTCTMYLGRPSTWQCEKTNLGAYQAALYRLVYPLSSPARTLQVDLRYSRPDTRLCSCQCSPPWLTDDREQTTKGLSKIHTGALKFELIHSLSEFVANPSAWSASQPALKWVRPAARGASMPHLQQRICNVGLRCL